MLLKMCFHDDVINWKHFPHYGHNLRESTGHRLVPLTKVCDAELWCFLWSAPEQMVEQTIETPVIWDVIVLIMTSLLWQRRSSGLLSSVSDALCHHEFTFKSTSRSHSLLSCICGNAAALPETQLRAAGAAARSQRSKRSQSSNSKCYRQ